MAIDIGNLASQMLSAALPKLTEGGSKVEEFAKIEFTKIAKRSVEIADEFTSGNLTIEDANELVNMQIRSTKIVFLTIDGLTTVTVEAAINAALGVVNSVINTTLKFTLIP